MTSNEKTKWVWGDSSITGDATDPGGFTEDLGGGYAPAGPTVTDDDPVTTKLIDPKTEIYRPGSEGEAELDPVVGWLVVVRGPGLGRSVQIGNGINSVGRDTAQRIALPFGDTMIARQDHVRIIYDDMARSFQITLGSGTNITRLNGQPVTQPMPLEDHALIQLSRQTDVRFVAFCNASFDWHDLSAEAKAPE